MTTTPTKIQALDELRPGRQWVCFNQDKEPHNPLTCSLVQGKLIEGSPEWASYEEAVKAWKANIGLFTGIGREFVKSQKITGIDLDHCIDEQGNLSPFAEDIVRRLNSYTEYSPSLRGLHIWVHGSIDKNLPADVEADGVNRLEMYDCKRYFTITGKHLEGTPTTIEDRYDELLAIHREHCATRQTAKAKREKPRSNASRQDFTQANGDTRYGLGALAKERVTLATTGEGGRNEQLNNSAFAMGQLIGGHELSRYTVERELSDAAAQAGLDEREIEGTLRSGIQAGMKSPRSAPTPQLQTATNGNGSTVSQNEQIATSQEQVSFNLTDLGNAERFKAKYGHKVRWCETWNKWVVFNDKCWEIDRSGRVDQLGKATVRAIYKEAAAEEDDDKRKKIVKHAAASESNRAVRAMLDRAKSELPITPEEFNTHLHLINCNNGTLDLRTGGLRQHNALDFLTRCIKLNYNPLAPCDQWKHFLNTIFAGDADLIKFIHQALGMSLSGDTSEQCLFICHGNGSNGKTTMLEAVRIIMAGYGLAANIESFQVRKNETVRNDIAELYGARLVTASENTIGSRLNEAFIKKATGKEPLRARRLHENEFEFMPELTLWLAVNHKPVVKDTTKGMWRRVHFIPFQVTFEEHQIDKHFVEKLLTHESEGIFAWLVQGCIAWYTAGRLNVPKAVKDATQAYKAEMDTTSNFLANECQFAEDERATTKELLERYESWCEENGEHYHAKDLKRALNERGLHSRRGTGGSYVYHGVRVLATDEIVNVSEGSEGSELKNSINTRDTTTLPKNLDFTSLPSLPSPSEHKNSKNSDGTFTFCQVDECTALNGTVHNGLCKKHWTERAPRGEK
jgi:putative DNA primase/helicase